MKHLRPGQAASATLRLCAHDGPDRQGVRRRFSVMPLLRRKRNRVPPGRHPLLQSPVTTRCFRVNCLCRPSSLSRMQGTTRSRHGRHATLACTNVRRPLSMTLSSPDAGRLPCHVVTSSRVKQRKTWIRSPSPGPTTSLSHKPTNYTAAMLQRRWPIAAWTRGSRVRTRNSGGSRGCSGVCGTSPRRDLIRRTAISRRSPARALCGSDRARSGQGRGERGRYEYRRCAARPPFAPASR